MTDKRPYIFLSDMEKICDKKLKCIPLSENNDGVQAENIAGEVKKQVLEPTVQHSFLGFFFFNFIYSFLERWEEDEKEREIAVCGCFSRAPYWGLGPQARHVP